MTDAPFVFVASPGESGDTAGEGKGSTTAWTRHRNDSTPAAAQARPGPHQAALAGRTERD